MPPEMPRDWLLPDGRARMQVLPKRAVRATATPLRSWVKAALKAVPEAAGSAVWIVKSADTITGAFQIAAYQRPGRHRDHPGLGAAPRARRGAGAWRRWCMSALLTVLLLQLSGMSLNFANIIALPLLLGVGVSFNIYFVMNWRQGIRASWARPRRARCCSRR